VSQRVTQKMCQFANPPSQFSVAKKFAIIRR